MLVINNKSHTCSSLNLENSMDFSARNRDKDQIYIFLMINHSITAGKCLNLILLMTRKTKKSFE